LPPHHRARLDVSDGVAEAADRPELVVDEEGDPDIVGPVQLAARDSGAADAAHLTHAAGRSPAHSRRSSPGRSPTCGEKAEGAGHAFPSGRFPGRRSPNSWSWTRLGR